MMQTFDSRRSALRAGSSTAGALLAALLATIPMSAAAQAADDVTLVFDNGLDGQDLTGALQAYDGKTFTLRASIGTIVIAADGVSCIGAACPEGTRPPAPETAAVEPGPEVQPQAILQAAATPSELVLTSLDGKSVVRGTLKDYIDGAYILETEVGQVAIRGDLVRCEGAGCVSGDSAPIPTGPVTVSREDIAIEGMLLGLEDGAYVLEVAGFGELRVSASDYACTGAACP